MAFEDFLPTILLGIAVAIGPFLAFTIYRLRNHKTLWKAFFFGWGGWFLALIARIIPLQVPALFLADSLATDTMTLLFYIAYASILAGLFEEGFRYIFLDQRKSLRSRGPLLFFALGWGIGEAIIIYVPSMIALPFLTETAPSLLEILPGAIERNIAILAHISFTFIVLRSVSSGKPGRKKFLILAMSLHAILNIVSVYTLILTQNAWLTELAAALTTAMTLYIAYRLTRKPQKK